MKKALLVIDYTNDFVADEGKLTCGKPGQLIEGKISTLIQQFLDQGELVVFLNDLHYENDPYHPETKLFPPHNIENTDGRNLYGSIQALYEAHKATVFSIDKRRYSAFAGTILHQILQEREIHDIHLVGVCTDICILHTAVDGFNLGYKLTIYKDAVASFDESGHIWALRHFQNTLGANLF